MLEVVRGAVGGCGNCLSKSYSSDLSCQECCITCILSMVFFSECLFFKNGNSFSARELLYHMLSIFVISICMFVINSYFWRDICDEKISLFYR